MQTGSMNKLARPECTQCSGDGAIRMARSLVLSRHFEVPAPSGKTGAPGFMWLRCEACGGEGRR